MGAIFARCLSWRMMRRASLVSLSNHFEACGDLGLREQVQKEASEMLSMRTLTALMRESLSLISVARLAKFQLCVIVAEKSDSHASLLLS